MNQSLPAINAAQLREPFENVLSTRSFGETGNDVAELISLGQLTMGSISAVLQEHGIKDIEKIKGEILDMLLSYIDFVLKDNFITAQEAENVRYLKSFFKIREGDFYSMRYCQIEVVLEKQFEYMYQDNVIEQEEALQKVELQSLFDLSYDQFLQLSERAVRKAIDRGANLFDLDTFIKRN